MPSNFIERVDYTGNTRHIYDLKVNNLSTR